MLYIAQGLFSILMMSDFIMYYFPAVLFTVEAERTVYESKFGEDVVMGCRFQPKLSNPHDADLKVTWHWFTSTLVRDVYRMDNWKENSAFQDPDYRGRVMLLTDELRDGWSKLKVNNGSHFPRIT